MMIFKKAMTLEEFEKVNNLNLYNLFEKSLEGTGQSTYEPDLFTDWLADNGKEAYEEAKLSQ